MLWRTAVALFALIWVSGQSGVCAAATALLASDPVVLSDHSPDFDRSAKARIVRLQNGLLVAVYEEIVEDEPNRYVFDLRGNFERPARDIFARVCPSGSVDCTVPGGGSKPINLSRTATESSIDTDWNVSGERTPYMGDSDTPHVFASGSHVVVTWVDKYCPGGAQRMRSYSERDDREIPFGCVYAAHASSDHGNPASWTVDRLTDGSRDPKQDNNRGRGSGAWALIWQEDPTGLELGQAEGPGEGASGAKTSHGTDIWYAFTSNVATATGAIGVWSTPVPITDNMTRTGPRGEVDPIFDSLGNPVPSDQIESGIAGASRANFALVGGSSPPTAVVAYEESKGSQGLAEGKFVRYQSFAFNAPPVDLADRIGCVVSNPAENARRARLVTQTNPGPASGLRWVLLWREGSFTQGGPADVMVRLGFNDFAPANLTPAVDAGCAAVDYATAIALDNQWALNVSSNTPVATEQNLADATDANIVENARAHRAVLRKDDLHVGYIYTPDWAVAEYTDIENYDFYLRRYDAARSRWYAPQNLSLLTDTTVNAVEPRLIGMPGSGPGCADPSDPADPTHCQDTRVIYAGWGTETNVYGWVESPVHLDIYLTRSTNRGVSFEPVIALAATAATEGELQLRTTPDGSLAYAVWNETNADGASNSMFSALAVVSDDRDDSGGGISIGCSLNGRGGFDSTLLIALAVLMARALLRQPKRVAGTSSTDSR